MIVKGGTALVMDPSGTVVEDAWIHIVDGKIASITKANPAEQKAKGSHAKIIDASQCLILPGLINCHTHSAMSLFRGLAEELTLHRWLAEVIFPAEQKFGTREFVHLGSLLSCVEKIRTGTTTTNDMYYFQEETVRAFHQAGVRIVGGQTFIEDHPGSMSHNPFEVMESYLSAVKQYPLAIPAIGPHAIYSLSEGMLLKVIEFARNQKLLIHMHVAETEKEVTDCKKEHGGKTPVEYLDTLGFWKEQVVAAHATCLTQNDIDILGRHHVGISHNPGSNLKLGTKIAPVVELIEAGAHVGLGTDSSASNNNLDLFKDLDLAAKLQSYVHGPGAFTAERAMRMVTSEGAKALGLEADLGSLEVGKKADLIAVDVSRANAVPLYNPYTHLVYSASGTDVRHTIVNGRVLMENFKLMTLDEESILEQSREIALRIKSHRDTA